MLIKVRVKHFKNNFFTQDDFAKNKNVEVTLIKTEKIVKITEFDQGCIARNYWEAYAIGAKSSIWYNHTEADHCIETIDEIYEQIMGGCNK